MDFIFLHCISSYIQKYGLKVYLRDPNAYTPLLEPQVIKGREVKSLVLGRDGDKNKQQIAQFSDKDAKVNILDTWSLYCF